MVRTRHQRRANQEQYQQQQPTVQNDSHANEFITAGEESVIENTNVEMTIIAASNDDRNSNVNNDSDSDSAKASFTFLGKQYKTYGEMVMAKRKRNTDFLASTGLLGASSKFKEEVLAADQEGRVKSRSSSSEGATQRGLRAVAANRKRKMSVVSVQQTRRKSNRLAGVQADGMYVEDEKGRGRVVIGGTNTKGNDVRAIIEEEEKREGFFNNRINDGSILSLKDAVELCGPKWVKEKSVSSAMEIISTLKGEFISSGRNSQKSGRGRNSSPTTITEGEEDAYSSLLTSQANSLTVDSETSVAKVVPDRIYSIAFHPSPHKLIAVAGDKNGHLGLWDVDAPSEEASVNLFKPYNSVISNLEWDSSGRKLFSSSYDGSMRQFDVEKEIFTEIFATYDSSQEYKDKPGFGLYDGWVQYSCLDHRNENCIFFSTSYGDVGHVDVRQKGKITFNTNLSEKKVNTVSLHPSGNTLATGGLDCTVKLWDVRKIASTKVSPIVTQRNSKSISSAFFSPSGKQLLTTTMSDNLDIFTDFHLNTGVVTKPTHRIRHNNQTGRWLSTFMAQWHPSISSSSSNEELFVVGSMQQPRTMQIFDGSKGELVRGIQGDALTAVVSRCCFHPSVEKLIVAGGNSSGRVTVAR